MLRRMMKGRERLEEVSINQQGEENLHLDFS